MKFNTAQPIPVLILGDAPDSRTGLGRIGHDLAWLFSGLPDFKVGYLARGGFGRAKYPWQQYSFGEHEGWGEARIEEAWTDLSQGVYGIILTVWDASRLLWSVWPEGLPQRTQEFLNSGKFARWGYFMLDGAGADPGRLPAEQTEVLSRYDRVLTASRWARGLVQASMQHPDLDWMPHPINRSVFKPGNRALARSFWGLKEQDRLIGCVMANQARKHWPVVFEALSMLPKFRLWLHSDITIRYWNLQALAVEYGVEDRVISEGRALTDSDLAARYSACDATVLISGGEGFGYPVAESLSCGVPVVTGSYGAAAELADPQCLVQAAWSALDTNHNVRRAYYSATDVAEKLDAICEMDLDSEARVAQLDGPLLAIQWRKWAMRGLP